VLSSADKKKKREQQHSEVLIYEICKTSFIAALDLVPRWGTGLATGRKGRSSTSTTEHIGRGKKKVYRLNLYVRDEFGATDCGLRAVPKGRQEKRTLSELSSQE